MLHSLPILPLCIIALGEPRVGCTLTWRQSVDQSQNCYFVIEVRRCRMPPYAAILLHPLSIRKSWWCHNTPTFTDSGSSLQTRVTTKGITCVILQREGMWCMELDVFFDPNSIAAYGCGIFSNSEWLPHGYARIRRGDRDVERASSSPFQGFGFILT